MISIKQNLFTQSEMRRWDLLVYATHLLVLVDLLAHSLVHSGKYAQEVLAKWREIKRELVKCILLSEMSQI